VRIFISYRRADSAPQSGRLRDALEGQFGSGSVFFDVNSIEVGETFTPAIDNALALSDVVLVMIGPTWATVGQPAGAPGTGRRLDDPRDLVRAEIRTAVDRGLDIIPVLVGGAAMPRADQLPDELKALAARNACELSDTRWQEGLEHLAATIARRAAGRTWPANPRVAEALDALKRQHYAAAADLFTSALSEDQTAETYYHRGLAYFFQHKLDAAVSDWNKALSLAPDWAMAYRQRANAFAELGRGDRARADYDRAIQLDPREPRAYFNRGLLRRAAGDVPGAVADLEQVLELRADAVLEREAESVLLDIRARQGKPAGGAGS
jgi:tetratricopeptide (TPR) repeat protein